MKLYHKLIIQTYHLVNKDLSFTLMLLSFLAVAFYFVMIYNIWIGLAIMATTSVAWYFALSFLSSQYIKYLKGSPNGLKS